MVVKKVVKKKFVKKKIPVKSDQDRPFDRPSVVGRKKKSVKKPRKKWGRSYGF